MTDRMPGSAPSCEFSGIPGSFLKSYDREIFAWAANLATAGPVLRIKLAQFPEMMRLGDAFAQYVSLSCTMFKHPISGLVKLTIEPASPKDYADILEHMDRLPAIVAAWRKVGAEQSRRAKQQVAAVFENIPDAFVKAYEPELRAWGQNLRASGGKRTIVLREVPGAPVAVDGWGDKPLLGAALVAEVEKMAKGVRLRIRPEDAVAEALIAHHAEDIERYGMPRKVN